MSPKPQVLIKSEIPFVKVPLAESLTDDDIIRKRDVDEILLAISTGNQYFFSAYVLLPCRKPFGNKKKMAELLKPSQLFST